MINEISAELVGKVNKARTLEGKPSKTQAAQRTLDRAVKKAWLKSSVGKIKEDSPVSANVTGTAVVGTGDDPTTWVKDKKKLRSIIKRKELEENDDVEKVNSIADKFKALASQKRDSSGKLKLPNVNDIPDSNPASKTLKIKEEKDYEGQMARAQLQIIAKRATALAEMMTDEMELEAWVQSKITNAEDYVTTVHDYMTTRKE
jgi:hypothetical protein